jgi:molybdopterin/thiamine biosynthesis adenylyltransferase
VTRVFPTDFRRADDEALRVDVVVDCLDDIPARRDLTARCRALDLSLVHGAVTGWYGQVGVQRPGDDLLDRLYPERTVRPAAAPPPVLACTVAVVASLQAAETLKLLLDLPSPLANSWLHIDLRDCSFERMS